MKMLYIIVSGVFILASSVSSQQINLEELITDAVTNNPALKSSLQRYEAMKARADQIGYLDDPKLGVGYFLQPVETRVGAQSTVLSISQRLPWFGTLNAKEQSAMNKAEANYQLYLDERNKLVFDIHALYSKMFAINASVAAVGRHMEWLKSFKSILITRYENGNTGLSSVLRIEMEEQSLANMRASLNEKIVTLRSQMEELTGSRVKESLAFPDSLPVPTMELSQAVLFQQMMDMNPLLVRFEYLESSWKESERFAQKMGLPSFTLGASYIFINRREDVVLADNGRDAFIFPQLGISIPLYRGKYNSMQSAARLEIDAVESSRQAAINKLSANLAAAMEAINNAKRDIKLFGNLLDLSERTRSIIVEEYANAKSGIDDIIQVERQYIEYQLKLEQARAEYAASVARLEYITGSRGLSNE